MKKKLKIILLSLGIGLLLLTGGGLLWLKNQSYAASSTAQSVSEQAVATKDYYYFSKTAEPSEIAVIFYPGALVDPASYSLWAEQVAAAGYDVYLLKLPLNLAVLAPDQAATVLNQQPQQHFVLAGHSLGGVMASRFARDHAQQVVGMLFLASYPDEKGSLQDSSLPVLSITATNDQVLNWDSYAAAKKDLPPTTVFSTIDGGNHAGFGSYGKQKGDGPAEISNQQQQQDVTQLVIDWLNSSLG